MKKRVLSLLLTLVMVLGLFPVSALAEETQPCSTWGCILGYGHSGDCEISFPGEGDDPADEPVPTDAPVPTDNPDQTAAQAVIDLIAAIGAVTLESESAISAADTAYNALSDAQKALVTNLDVLDAAKAAFSALSVPSEIDNSTDEAINLTLTVSNQGVLALVKGSFAAKDMNDDGIITYDEAMWAAHEKYYPGGYEVDYESAYGATVMKVWGAGEGSNANALFLRNGIPLTMNVGDTEASVVSEGDALYVSVNVSEMGTDWYTYFDKEYLTVNAGQEFALTLSGFLGMTWGEPVPAVVPDATVGIWDGGNFSAIDGKTTDSNGQVSLSFDAAGTYVVSASGSIYDEMWYSDCPLMAPYCVVTVKSSEVAVEAVSLDKSSLELTVGDIETLTATVGPENATDKTVTWTSDNEAVATVADGVVTAVAAGTTNITAKAGEKTATCAVTVKEAVKLAEPQDITVTISNKSNLVMMRETVTVTDYDQDGSLDVDDALYAAHEKAYTGGAAAGYASNGSSASKLWGQSGGTFVYYINDESCWQLSQTIKADDYIVACVCQDKYGMDSYAKFSESSYTTTMGTPLSVALEAYDMFSEKFSPLEGAVISCTTDGVCTVDGYNLTFSKAGTYYITAAGPEGTILVPPVAVVTVEEAEEPLVEKTVYVTLSDRSGSFAIGKNGDLLYRFPVKTTDDASAPDGKITLLEVLTALHEQQHTDGSSAVAATSSYISKLWGVTSGIAGYCLNDISLDGEGTKTGTNGRGFEDKLLDTAVEDNDYFNLWLLQDTTYYSDVYTYFNPSSVSTTTGTYEFTVYGNSMFNPGGQIPAGAAVKVYDINGAELAELETTVDKDGKFSINFSTAGKYTVELCSSETVYIVPSRCSVTVTGDPSSDVVTVTGVELNKSTTELRVGGTETLTAKVLPTNATDKAVSWTSSDDKVASVDSNGKITALAVGSATITVTTNNGKYAECAVTVVPVPTKPLLDELIFSNSSAREYLKPATTFTLSPALSDDVQEYKLIIPDNLGNVYAYATPDSAFSGKTIRISYTNINGEVAFADVTSAADRGEELKSIISAGSLESIPMTISIGGEEAYTVTIVRQAVLKNGGLKISDGEKNIDLSPTFSNTTYEYTASVPLDASLSITATRRSSASIVSINGGSETTVKPVWSADNTADLVIKVSGGEGTSNVVESTYTVHLTGIPTVAVTGVTLDKTTASITVGKTETLTATVAPDNATDKTVTWSSSNETIATVADGVVTAVAAGTATITAKAGEVTASCKVTVTENLPTLSALKFSAGSAATSVEYVLEPAFDPAVREYTVIVPDNTNQFFAWATLGEGLTNNPKIKIKYLNTSGKEKETSNITSGATKGVTVSGFLRNGHDVKELSVLIAGETAYTVKVVRKSQLTGITLNDSEVPLTPAFSNTTTEYSATVAYDKELTLKATATFSTSTFTVNGQPVDAVNKAATVSFIPQWDDMSSVVTVVAGSSVEGARPTEYTIKLSQRATKIEIQTPPDKTEYKPGDKFDPAGMTLLATYSDGSTKTITPDNFSYSPTEELSPAVTEVTISYDSLTVTQPIKVADAFKGSGTEEDPYLIETADDLVKLSELVASGVHFKGEFIKMVNDIELPSGWNPVGSSTARFKGTFDGDGKLLTVPAGGLPLFGYVGGATIKNLSIYGSQIAGYGLINNFNELDENASDMGVTVSGITLKSGSSTLKSGLLGSEFAGNPYAGSTRFSAAHISGCTIESGVIIGYNADQSYIGSIAGRMQGSITGCTSNATVKGVNYVGGILGSRDNGLGTCSISGSSFGGSVSASGSHAGGIVGGGYVGFTAAVEASAPNGNRTSITGCTVTGSVSGTEKVGGIIGGDSFVVQTWLSNSIKNNSFSGSVNGSSYVGGIIGFYNSLNKFDDIANNYYTNASTGIGFVKYIDTNCSTHETSSGAVYFNTENGTSGVPSVTGSNWRSGHNRTDDPLGADKAKLCYTDADTEPVATELKVSGTYKTEYIKGEALDLTGIVLTVNYNKGDPKTIELKDVTVTGYDKDKLGDQELTISYEGLTALIKVNVKNDKDEITVTVSVLGDSIHGDGGTVHTLVGGNLGTWVSATKYTVDSSFTAWDVIKKCLDENGYSYSNPTGNYIVAINGLAEFSNGKLSGWMYTLNGGHSSLGVSEQHLDDGDVIVVHYSDDFTIDDPMGGAPNANNAAAVEKLIKEIGTVTLDSKSKIEAARKAYDALSYADKQNVSNYKTLTDAEAEYAKLKEEDDKKTAKEVVDLINAIGKFSDEFKDKVKAARKAYDALTDDQKKLVDNYDLLVQAEKLLATEEDKKAAEEVEKLIKLIGNKVTLDSKKKIELARKAYDMLTNTQKNLVDNYKDLLAAEETLARLEELEETMDIYKLTGNYMEKLGTPTVANIGGEWMVLGLARSDRKVADGYYDNVVKFVQENIDENERLHSAKSSENSRVILGLTAIGKDVTNVDGHNLLKGLTDMDYLNKQGINGPIWALIAFDSGNYPVPEGNVSRAALIDTILEAQLSDGGWALAGEVSDPDMTGMALAALAPYYANNDKAAKPIVEKYGKERTAEIKKAVEEALKTLSEMQDADGGFSSIDGPNCESIAQVIVALSALGIDADTDRRFIKKDVSALDALCTYFVEGGGFRHVMDAGLDGMATEQAYYALTAYFRMVDGKSALYDMTEIIDKGGDKELVKAEEPKTEKAEEETKPAPTEAPKASESKRPSFWQWLKNLFS